MILVLDASPIEHEIWCDVDRQKILRQKSYHFAWFLHLPVKYVTFHITWVATFLHHKMKYEVIFNFFWVTNFLFSLHELFCFKKSPSFGPAAEDDVTCERNCMKKISFQSAHWRKWMKWDWWKLFKDSILRQNCNLGKIKCVLRLSKDFFLKSVYKHTLPTKKNWERQSLPSEYTGQFFHCEKITPVL